MAEVLDVLLRHLRTETSLFARVELGAPWGARVGPKDTVLLHHVVEGEMWLEADGTERRIAPGDLLILPHGLPHAIRHRPGAAVEDERRWGAPPVAPGLAIRRRLGGPGATTVVLCASLDLLGASRSLLLRALPPVVHVPGTGGRPVAALGRILDGIRDEVRESRRGASIVASRWAELLLLQGIRLEFERAIDPGLPRTGVGDAPGAPRTGVGDAPGSWRVGLSDERIARALDASYGAPQRRWTVAGLARVAGMSRAGFAQRFRALVGETPLDHLTHWRMELAKVSLRERPETTLAEVASSVGYASEAAFSVAFRKVVGMPPGAYRGRPPAPARATGRRAALAPAAGGT